MSLRRSGYRFGPSGAAPIVACAVILAGGLWLPGCASVSIEEAVPAEALATSQQEGGIASGTTTASTDTPVAEPDSVVAAEAQPPGAGPSAPRDSGQYPNLNVPRRSAATQLSESETAAQSSALKAAAAQQGQGAAGTTATPSDLRALQKLRETHAAEALKEIEGE